MLRALGHDVAGPFRRSGIEIGRSWYTARDTGRLIKALFIAFKPVRPEDRATDPVETEQAEGEQAAKPRKRNERGILALRCTLWLTIGWQLGLVSPEASTTGNLYRGLWITVAGLWSFGMLFPERPKSIEIACMVGAIAWALWPA